MRTLAIGVRSSPRRFQAFKDIQLERDQKPVVGMIRDVRTRWNSTMKMLQRAVHKKEALKIWCETFEKFTPFYPTPDEWRQIEYVITVLQPFEQYTRLLSSTSGVTIQNAWGIYNNLFAHIEKVMTMLEKKRLPWKRSIYQALPSARDKLAKYYGKTTGRGGTVYNIGTVLNPNMKLSVYEQAEWVDEDEPEDWKSTYKQEFKQCYNTFYRHLEHQPDRIPENIDLTLPPTESAEQELSSLFLRRQYTSSHQIDGPLSEATHYLKDKVEEGVDILKWWKLHENQFPNLSRMARDFLAVPIAGVGVERVFSIARDVVPYRRNSLQSTTIRDIMLTKSWYKELSNFEVTDESNVDDNPEIILAAIRMDSRFCDDLYISDVDETGVAGPRVASPELPLPIQARREKRPAPPPPPLDPGRMHSRLQKRYTLASKGLRDISKRPRVDY